MLHIIRAPSGQFRPIALIGMTGCGKTTVGKISAEKTGVSFFDLDAEIIRRSGKSVADIFRESGENGFREIERKTLCTLLEAKEPLVLACGGGAILREENRALLREKSYIVWLQRDPEMVLADKQILRRPPICGQKSNYMALLAKRTPLYSALADTVLEAENHSPDEIAKELCDYFATFTKKNENDS